MTFGQPGHDRLGDDPSPHGEGPVHGQADGADVDLTDGDRPDGDRPDGDRVERDRVDGDRAVSDGVDGAAIDGADGDGRPTGGDVVPARRKPRLTFWQELPLLVIAAVVLAVLIKTFAFQAFYIPSGSMEQTLHGCTGCRGDRVMVNKVVYHLRDIHRGDIVVFDGKDNYFDEPTFVQTPTNPVARGLHDIADFIGLAPQGTDYIKRVIGLPGDTVQCCDTKGRVMINGVGINEPYVYLDGPDGNKTFGPTKVPAGHLWVMGDHRNDSQDSRVVKAIPENDVIGRAFAIIWPPSRVTWLSDPNVYGAVPKAASALPLVVSTAIVSAFAGVRRRRRRRRSHQPAS